MKFARFFCIYAEGNKDYENIPNIAKPFLKWAGGKGQLLSQLEAALPYELNDEEFTYFELFVGGGAMLFFMLQKSVY